MPKPSLFTLSILLFGLAPLAHAASPDRCATLDEYGYPKSCDPIGWRDAPYWNDDVCCGANGCVEPGRLVCSAAEQRYHCEYAELDALGYVQCLFPVPYYCDEYECPASSPEYQPHGQAQSVCCEHGGACWPYNQSTDGACQGQMLWCQSGTCNDDGTITCDDPEDQ
jgi:hypothetical protein